MTFRHNNDDDDNDKILKAEMVVGVAVTICQLMAIYHVTLH